MTDRAVKIATQVTEVVEDELTRFWLRPGERLVLTGVPIRGYVGVLLAGERHVPYTPDRDGLPSVNVGPARWPLPAQGVLNEDWTDDPTLGYWVLAQGSGQFAVRLVDHFAASLGEARLVLTNQRLAVLYPTKILTEPPDPALVFTTFEETSPNAVRGLTATTSGRSVPPRPLLRFDFVDGSTLLVKDVLAPAKVAKAFN